MKDVTIEALLSHDRFVRRLALSLMRDSATAEDATQELYLQALRRAPGHGGSLRNWLSTALRHVAANLRRARVRRFVRERAAARAEAQPRAAVIEREELRRCLVTAIVGLGEPRSTVVLLRYFEGLTPRAIGARLAMPVETVRTHLKRSLSALREKLDAEMRPDGKPFLHALPILLTGPKGLAAAIGVLMTAKSKSLAAAIVVLVAAAAWFVVFGAEVADRNGFAARLIGTVRDIRDS